MFPTRLNSFITQQLSLSFLAKQKRSKELSYFIHPPKLTSNNSLTSLLFRPITMEELELLQEDLSTSTSDSSTDSSIIGSYSSSALDGAILATTTLPSGSEQSSHHYSSSSSDLSFSENATSLFPSIAFTIPLSSEQKDIPISQASSSSPLLELDNSSVPAIESPISHYVDLLPNSLDSSIVFVPTTPTTDALQQTDLTQSFSQTVTPTDSSSSIIQSPITATEPMSDSSSFFGISMPTTPTTDALQQTDLTQSFSQTVAPTDSSSSIIQSPTALIKPVTSLSLSIVKKTQDVSFLTISPTYQSTKRNNLSLIKKEMISIYGEDFCKIVKPEVIAKIPVVNIVHPQFSQFSRPHFILDPKLFKHHNVIRGQIFIEDSGLESIEPFIAAKLEVFDTTYNKKTTVYELIYFRHPRRCGGNTYGTVTYDHTGKDPWQRSLLKWGGTESDGLTEYELKKIQNLLTKGSFFIDPTHWFYKGSAWLGIE